MLYSNPCYFPVVILYVTDITCLSRAASKDEFFLVQTFIVWPVDKESSGRFSNNQCD